MESIDKEGIAACIVALKQIEDGAVLNTLQSLQLKHVIAFLKQLMEGIE